MLCLACGISGDLCIVFLQSMSVGLLHLLCLLGVAWSLKGFRWSVKVGDMHMFRFML